MSEIIIFCNLPNQKTDVRPPCFAGLTELSLYLSPVPCPLLSVHSRFTFHDILIEFYKEEAGAGDRKDQETLRHADRRAQLHRHHTTQYRPQRIVSENQPEERKYMDINPIAISNDRTCVLVITPCPTRCVTTWKMQDRTKDWKRFTAPCCRKTRRCWARQKNRDSVKPISLTG